MLQIRQYWNPPSIIIIYKVDMTKQAKYSKYIYVIRLFDPSTEENQKNLIQSVSPMSKIHFKLALGDESFENNEPQHPIPMNPLEQEKNKKSHYQLNFDLKKEVFIKRDDILIYYPITCTIAANKMSISEEQFRKMKQEFKKLDTNQESDNSSNYDSEFRSENQYHHDEPEFPRRGRPPGSKNKKKGNNEQSSSDESYENSTGKRGESKRGRGRPKGAKNKKKVFYDNIQNESNFHTLFKNLLQSKPLDELMKKISKSRKKQIRKDEQQLEKKTHKPGRKGRPPGAKNKKNESRESDSQQHQDPPPPRNKPKKIPKCCSRCTQRDLKRQYLEGKNNVEGLRNLAENLGVEDTENLIINAIRKNQLEGLKKLLKQVNKIENQFVVPWICSQRLQKTHYTIRTRKEYVAKNQREGNNALLQDMHHSSEKWWRVIGIERILENFPKYESGKEIYEFLIRQEPELEEVIYHNIPTLVRSGNGELAHYLLTKIVSTEENTTIYGYSKDHVECLNPERSQITFKKSTMLKQNCTENFCSPIHCAVINQNTDLLAYILKHISEFNVGDSLCRKPVHYAAVLQSTKPLELLVKYGGDLKEMDKRKMTPLMLAAQHGCYNIIKYILEKTKDTHYINFKGEEGLSALHYATIGKHHECIELLLNDELIEKNSETKEKFTILHLAAGGGCLDTVRMIIDKGVHLTNDCFRRSPLMIALRNHHNDIFFQLLQENQTVSKKDYSNNTLLHYAAAYGNIQLVMYLLPIIKSDRNKRNFYPWELAILKGHLQCAKKLYDKNLSFDRHLLLSILKNPRGTNQYISIVKYLLQANLYQIDYSNHQGNTCLHLVCNINEQDYLKQRRKQTSEIPPNQYEFMENSLITLLLQHGASTDKKNDKGQRPVDLCIENENLIGIQLLLDEIPFQFSSPTKSNNFIYYLTNIACRGNEQMNFVYEKLAEVNEKTLRQELKKTEWNGFKFLIYLIKRYTESIRPNFRKIYLKKLSEFPKGNEITEEVQKQFIREAFDQCVKHERSLIKLVNFLVENGAEPKSTVQEPKLENQQENYRKWGIQHFLMRFPSKTLIKLFNRWTDTCFNTPNTEGRTPLHLFCMWNREGCLFNSQDMAPVPYIDFLLHPDYDGQACLVDLLEKGLGGLVTDFNKSTPLHYAALNGQLKFMKSLSEYGSTMVSCNSLNQVPLIEIIKSKHKHTLEQIEDILRDEPKVIDVKDLNHRNLLHHLVANARNFDFSPELCQKLIEYGVKVNSLDKYGRSPIFYCFINIKDEENQDNTNNTVQILQTLLKIEDINLNIVDIHKRTPLHYACEKNSFISILYLLEKNINYDLEDTEGNTPLAICLKHGHLNQAAMIIQKQKQIKHGFVKDQGHQKPYFTYTTERFSPNISFMLIDYGYPVQKALEEVPSEAIKEKLKKKYINKSEG